MVCLVPGKDWHKAGGWARRRTAVLSKQLACDGRPQPTALTVSFLRMVSVPTKFSSSKENVDAAVWWEGEEGGHTGYAVVQPVPPLSRPRQVARGGRT